MGMQRIVANEIFALWGKFLHIPKIGHRSLLYHSISQDSDVFTISPAPFQRHIEILENLNIPIRPFYMQEEPRGFSISLTFDDGYLNTLTVAAPLLVKKGWPFTVFVISDFIKNRQTGYLSLPELKALTQLPGVTIGSHSKTHQPMAKLTAQEQIEEMTESKKYLEDAIGKAVETFAFPHGSFNTLAIQTAKLAGYKKVGTSNIQLNTKSTYLVGRTSIFHEDQNNRFLGKIKGSWDFYDTLKNIF